jgi:integrase
VFRGTYFPEWGYLLTALFTGRRNLKPLMRAAGLPETTRPYDLRHTFATLMLEQGENPKVVQEVLGHSSITHTMDTYSHVSPNIQKEAFGRLGKRLKGP